MKNFALFVAIVALTGCSKDNTFTPDNREVKTTLTATAGSESRSYIENDKSIKWHNDDAIGVFHAASENKEFTITTNNGASATFEGMTSEDEGNYIAYFPYAADATMLGTTLTLAQAVKDTQTMTEGSFDPKAMTTVAYGATTDLQFRNLCGLAKITLQDPTATIKSISIESGDGTTVLAGAGTVAMDYADGSPVLAMTGAATVVSLTSAEGIALGETGKTFYIVLPPCTMNGVKLTVTAIDNRVYTKTSANTLTIARSHILDLGTIALELEAPKPNFQSAYTLANYYQWDAATSCADGGAYNQANTASQSCMNCPTAQEMVDYLVEGWYWDNGDVAENGLQTFSAPTNDESSTTTSSKGIWLKKKSKHTKPYAVTFNNRFFNGSDTKYYKGAITSDNAATIRTRGDYFFLPATGYYDSSKKEFTGVDERGNFWSSTPSGATAAYYLGFYADFAGVGYDNRNYGYLPLIAE